MVEIEIIRTETIKPSSPTPDSLKRFRLSAFDQFIPDTYRPLVFLYPHGGENSFSDRIKRLKLSLSEALVRFYPLAGRLVRDKDHVDCHDGGVDFLEAKVNGRRLSDILGHPEHDNDILKLIPALTDAQPLIRVQATVLECGGIAVGVGFRHLVVDACAMSAFLKGWAAVARGDLGSPDPDLYSIASRFPAIPGAFPPSAPPEVSECSTRRFVFQAAKIDTLIEKSATPGEERPTPVEAVSALIWKCIVNALTKRPGHGTTPTRPLIVCLPVNLRGRLDPPVSENSLGNMVAPLLVESGRRNDVQGLASQLGQVARDITQNYVPRLQDSEVATRTIWELGKRFTVSASGSEDRDFYLLCNWCGYGWYEVDFGWGRPAWMSAVSSNVKNVAVMVDTEDGCGIEVLVTLSEEDMIFFEMDPELREFACLNPTVCPQIRGWDGNN